MMCVLSNFFKVFFVHYHRWEKRLMCRHLRLALGNVYLECTTAFLESVKWICKKEIQKKK